MPHIKNPHPKILQAMEILHLLGVPRTQQNPRTGLCLLALLNITPRKSFTKSENPLVGITPIMEFCQKNYHIEYAPNSRETFRRQSMHQLVQAGIVNLNPDDTNRPTNSPNTVYQLSPDALLLLRTYKTALWKQAFQDYQISHNALSSTYAKTREIAKIPVNIYDKKLKLSPGKHNKLVKAIIEEFAAYFLKNASLVYVGDTAKKSAFADMILIQQLHIPFSEHNKLPDIIFYLPNKNWLVFVESVISHGPMDAKRHFELEQIFKDAKAEKVYITAFPDKETMRKYIAQIAWETEVWIADSPTHLIHFNGSKFLGPYSEDD